MVFVKRWSACPSQLDIERMCFVASVVAARTRQYVGKGEV